MWMHFGDFRDIAFQVFQHTQRKLLNFENLVNGEVSKIGHHFRK